MCKETKDFPRRRCRVHQTRDPLVAPMEQESYGRLYHSWCSRSVWMFGRMAMASSEAAKSEAAKASSGQNENCSPSKSKETKAAKKTTALEVYLNHM